MKFRFTPATILCIGFSLAILVVSYHASTRVAHSSLNGRVGFSGNPASNGGQSCTACHGAGADLPTVTLDGPTAVTASTTNIYTVTITGGPAQTGGVNVSSEEGKGDLHPLDSDLQLLLGELTHSAPKAFTANRTTFRFAWTAPEHNGAVTFYAAGNSSNGQEDLTGDGIDTTSITVDVTGGDPNPPESTPTPTPAALTLETVVSGLNQPVDIQHAGDSRLFIAEKFGRILLYDGSMASQPYLNLTGRVTAGGGNAETGLLGLAFHPDYATNGYFYVNYTVGSPLRTRVSRFTVSADPAQADAASELILMEIGQPFVNHNGGQLQFGPDGYLYIGTGDGGSGGDPDDNGQENGTLLGKILRIDVDGGTASPPECSGIAGTNYMIPADNPFADGNGGNCDEIWATGLRNPWRFSFDKLTGEQWIADVGQNRFEEINFAPAAVGGQNYGWRCYEATTAYNSSGCAARENYTFPIQWHNRAAGDCSITGGYVYRGSAFPALNGHYFFSDFCNDTIRSISGGPDSPILTSWSRSSGGSNITTFGQDVNGELYVGFLSGQVAKLIGPSVPATAMPTSTPITSPTPTTTPNEQSAEISLGEPAFVTGTNAVELPLLLSEIPAGRLLGAVTMEVQYDRNVLSLADCAMDPAGIFDSTVCNASIPGTVVLTALAAGGLSNDLSIANLTFEVHGLSRLSQFILPSAITFTDVDGNTMLVNAQSRSFELICRFGDVDCNEVVDPGDARLIVRYAVELVPESMEKPPPAESIYLPACDISLDGSCTPQDAMLILQCTEDRRNSFCP